MKSDKTTFWDHLEVVRWVLIRCLAVVVLLAVGAFCYKDFLFDRVVLAPCHPDFATYRALCLLGQWLGMPDLCPRVQPVELININLSSQLMTHLSVSFYVALLVALPYILVEVWLFVSPALYARERKPAVAGVVAFFFQFFLGLLLAYYIIFPLTFQFLGTYQVSASICNQISLNSYISTFLGLLFTMALVFEMPIVAYFFARIGVLTSAWLRKYRKVAFVVSLVAAAIITPSTDVFTMMLVALPLYALYEFSRLIVRRVERLNTENNKIKKIS